MLRKSIGITVLLLTSVTMYASVGGIGGFNLGAGFPGIQNLNDRLKPYGLDLKSHMIISGGSGYALARNLILGGFGYGGSVQSENPDMILEFSGGGGGFEIGRVWDAGPGWFAVMATLGGFGYSLKIRPKLADVDFDSLLANPRRVATLTTGSVLVGASGMYIFPVSGPFSLGVKAGVYYTPMVKDWKLEDGAAVFNAPQLQPFHYSIQVMLMFGKVVKSMPNAGSPQ